MAHGSVKSGSAVLWLPRPFLVCPKQRLPDVTSMFKQQEGEKVLQPVPSLWSRKPKAYNILPIPSGHLLLSISLVRTVAHNHF